MSDSIFKWYHMVFVFLFLTSLSMVISSCIHVAANGFVSFFFFMAEFNNFFFNNFLMIKNFSWNWKSDSVCFWLSWNSICWHQCDKTRVMEEGNGQRKQANCAAMFGKREASLVPLTQSVTGVRTESELGASVGLHCRNAFFFQATVRDNLKCRWLMCPSL